MFFCMNTNIQGHFQICISVALMRFRGWALAIKVGLSPSKKIYFVCFIESPLKIMKNAFYFILKAFFVLKTFELLLSLSSRKNDFDQKDNVKFQNLWHHSLVNKQLQYTYCQISQKVKTTRQRNLVCQQNKMRKIFFIKKYKVNQVGRLVPNHFLFIRRALYEVKRRDMQLTFNLFRWPSTWYIMEINCLKLQTIDPEISSVLIFRKKVWQQFFHLILRMIFKEHFFLCHIL